MAVAFTSEQGFACEVQVRSVAMHPCGINVPLRFFHYVALLGFYLLKHSFGIDAVEKTNYGNDTKDKLQFLTTRLAETAEG